MLRIQRLASHRVVFALSGRIEMERAPELRRLLEAAGKDRVAVLDLRDVTLVDRGAVKFLARCEADGVKLENCPFYVREWINSESGRISRRKRSSA
jgi:anti-anti-sigma regulatory factor